MSRSVVRPERPKHLALGGQSLFLTDGAGKDGSLEHRVAVDLGDSEGDVGALCGVVVLPVVHECLTERRRAVETCNTEVGEVIHRVDPRDAEEMQLGLRLEHIMDAFEAGQDLGGLEWNHAAQRDSFVSHVLQGVHAIGETLGTPALCSANWLDGGPSLAGCVDELLGKSQRETSTFCPLRGDMIHVAPGS